MHLQSFANSVNSIVQKTTCFFPSVKGAKSVVRLAKASNIFLSADFWKLHQRPIAMFKQRNDRRQPRRGRVEAIIAIQRDDQALYRRSLFPLKDLRVTSRSGRSRGWTRSRDSSILRRAVAAVAVVTLIRGGPTRNSICVTSAAERIPVTSMQTSRRCVNKCVRVRPRSCTPESYDLPESRVLRRRDRRKANALICSTWNWAAVARACSYFERTNDRERTV